jgi:hypothetical protein
MTRAERCDRCGEALEVLRHPIRRLGWTRYWWQGVASYFTGQLRVCSRCGAVYNPDGDLLAAGAVATDTERRLDTYRRDMAYLRDAFGAVIIAAEVAVIWLAAGQSVALVEAILAGVVGVGSFVPFVFFGRKARLAKRELKRLKEGRLRGEIPLRTGGKG